MFNLEQQISNWREQMLAAGITFEDLDELETHLRDDMAQLLKSGLSENEAFTISTVRIGSTNDLKAEFQKTNEIIKGLKMKRIITTVAGLFGMAFGLGVILPALARHYHHPELQPGLFSPPLFIGSIVLAAGAITARYCIQTRHETRGRIAIAIALLFACAPFFGTAIAQLFRTDRMTPAGWVAWALTVAASAAYFGSCFRLNWRQPGNAR